MMEQQSQNREREGEITASDTKRGGCAFKLSSTVSLMWFKPHKVTLSLPAVKHVTALSKNLSLSPAALTATLL